MQKVVQSALLDLKVSVHERFAHAEVAVAEHAREEAFAVHPDRDLADALGVSREEIRATDAEENSRVGDTRVQQFEEEVTGH